MNLHTILERVSEGQLGFSEARVSLGSMGFGPPSFAHGEDLLVARDSNPFLREMEAMQNELREEVQREEEEIEEEAARKAAATAGRSSQRRASA